MKKTFEILKKVPIPSLRGTPGTHMSEKNRQALETLKRLKVGDSFIFPKGKETDNYFGTIISTLNQKYVKHKITTRRVIDSKKKVIGIQVWRLPDSTPSRSKPKLNKRKTTK